MDSSLAVDDSDKKVFYAEADYSKEEIDKEIEELVQWAYERAVEILKKNESPFVYLTQLLKDKRDLYVDDFRKRNISF